MSNNYGKVLGLTGAIACFWLAGMPTAACWAVGAGTVGAIAITININYRNYEGVTGKTTGGLAIATSRYPSRCLRHCKLGLTV